MATAKLNNFTFQQLSEAVGQIFSSERFWTVNAHVPAAERAQVRHNVVTSATWPAYPLFSPYAATHDGYSQSKSLSIPTSIQLSTSGFAMANYSKTVRYKGTKFLVHRITFRHKYGGQLDDTKELSHIVNCGLRTSS